MASPTTIPSPLRPVKKSVANAALRSAPRAQTDTQADQRPSGDLVLPELRWLEVVTVQVDQTYQHEPYTKAIEELSQGFIKKYCGPILVNVRADGSIWVIDGATRLGVHRRLKYEHILAEVHTGFSEKHEAEIYLLKCKNIQRQPIDWFKAETKAGIARAVLLQGILTTRQITVTPFAPKKWYGRHPGQEVSCLGTLYRLLKKDAQGEKLEAALDLLKATWGDQEYLTSFMIETMHLLLMSCFDLNRKAFVDRLRQWTLRDLRDEARIYQMAHPKSSLRMACCHKIVEHYNERRSVGRLEL